MDKLLLSFGKKNGLKYETSGTEHWIYGQYRGHSFLCQLDMAMHQFKVTCVYNIFRPVLVTKRELSQSDKSLTANDIVNLFTNYFENPMAESITHTLDVTRLHFEDDSQLYTQKKLKDVLDNVSEFADAFIGCYAEITTLGGEAISVLQEISNWKGHALEPIAWQLLQDIAQQTTKALTDRCRHLLCPKCFTFCTSNYVEIVSDRSITYYGCRTCHQSNEFFDVEGVEVVAILDSNMVEELIESENILYINWFIRRQLFDFAGVEIIHASDEDVERFAVQIGNDTDLLRQPFYDQMPCVVSLNCDLSQNTIRILENIFEEVSRQPIPQRKIG